MSFCKLFFDNSIFHDIIKSNFSILFSSNLFTSSQTIKTNLKSTIKITNINRQNNPPGPSTLSALQSTEVFFEFKTTKQKHLKKGFIPLHKLSMGLVEIEILKKSEENKPVHVALIQDNNENILFSPFIFKESLNHFEETCVNSIDLFQYTVEEIKRKKYLNSVVKDVPSTVNAKIGMIIRIIKNTENYIGLMTYH